MTNAVSEPAAAKRRARSRDAAIVVHDTVASDAAENERAVGAAESK